MQTLMSVIIILTQSFSDNIQDFNLIDDDDRRIDAWRPLKLILGESTLLFRITCHYSSLDGH